MLKKNVSVEVFLVLFELLPIEGVFFRWRTCSFTMRLVNTLSNAVE